MRLGNIAECCGALKFFGNSGMGRYARQIRTFDMASAICWRSLPPTIGSELVCEPLTFRLVFVVGENVVVV
jgi:hypothetical protein